MGLTVLRLLLAPVLVWLVYANAPGIGIVEPFVAVAIGLGLIAEAEGLMISVVLPAWTHDVPTVFQALRIKENHSGGATDGKQKPS
jgi:hypothetical protein